MSLDYLDVVVDSEMIEYVQEFLIWIQTQVPPGGEVHSEIKVVTGIDPEIKGTVDLAFEDWPDVLHAADFKYGQGNQIDAEDCEQLAIYALGLIEKFGSEFETIKMTIYQPRGKGPTVKTWEMPMAKFIKKWTKKIAKGHSDCLTKPNLFRPGSWCKYCRGITECSRAKRETNKLAKADAVVPRDAKALGRILKLETAVLEYLNDCKKRAFELLSSGEKVPGFKLVQTWGREKWSDETEAKKVLYDFGNDVMNTKLKTPKQVRKILLDDCPEELDKLTMTPNNGLKLVPEADKRKAYQSAQQDFADVDSN